MSKPKRKAREPKGHIWDRIALAPDGCWLWTGKLNRSGYGVLHHSAYYGAKFAHRLAYQTFVGPIPEGLTIDHLCRVRHCVNPKHLEPVAQLENVRRGVSFAARNGKKTHCPKGHPYSGENLKQSPGEGRRCRTCLSVKYRRITERKRGSEAR